MNACNSLFPPDFADVLATVQHQATHLAAAKADALSASSVLAAIAAFHDSALTELEGRSAATRAKAEHLLESASALKEAVAKKEEQRAADFRSLSASLDLAAREKSSAESSLLLSVPNSTTSFI